MGRGVRAPGAGSGVRALRGAMLATSAVLAGAALGALAPGAIDSRYIARVAQVVGWAKRAGLYVVIDMHQDAWSKYVYTRPNDTCVPPFQSIRGFDGAPQWASEHLQPACALNGVRELDPA